MNDPQTLDKGQAQRFMSQLMDGELSPADADRLNTYLQAHPDDIDWMESLDALRDAESQIAPADVPIDSIRAAIDDSEKAEKSNNLISFPSLFRSLAAAAAVAIVGSVTWLGFRHEATPTPHLEPAVVEFVATDIPDASTFVYSDDESGWTVVWVETDSSLPEDHG